MPEIEEIGTIKTSMVCGKEKKKERERCVMDDGGESSFSSLLQMDRTGK